jgi:hypothetical protein
MVVPGLVPEVARFPKLAASPINFAETVPSEQI